MQNDRTHQMAQHIQDLIDDGPTPAALNETMAHGPGPDATRFTASTGRVPMGLFLGVDRLELIDVPERMPQPVAMIEDLVGKPVDCIAVLPDLDFWISQDGPPTGQHNVNATAALTDLLHDIISGDYVAADKERGQIQAMLATGPRIVGPCLVLGRHRGTGDSTGLPPAFLSWLEGWFDGLEARIIASDLINAIAASGIQIAEGATIRIAPLD